MTVRREKYGKPTLIQPRLAQGTFRVVVTDSYNRRCAVTGERVLPVFEAAHIRPFADGGEHLVENGLLLRSDAHILFDRGYMTMTPEHRVVSDRLNRSARRARWNRTPGAILTRQIAPKRSVVAVMAPVTLAGPFPAMRPFPGIRGRRRPANTICCPAPRTSVRACPRTTRRRGCLSIPIYCRGGTTFRAAPDTIHRLALQVWLVPRIKQQISIRAVKILAFMVSPWICRARLSETGGIAPDSRTLSHVAAAIVPNSEKLVP